MKLNLPNFTFNRKTSPIWVTGLGVIGLMAILLIVWSTRGGSTIDSAIATYKAGNVQEALDLFAQARDKNQINTAEEWNIYGNVYRDAKHLPEAAEAYQKAIKADSGYESAYRNLSYLYADWAEQDKDPQKLQQAIGIIENGRKSHPKSITMVEDLIMLYGKVGDSAKVAELQAIRTLLLK